MRNENAITNIRRQLDRMSTALAQAAPYIEDAGSPEVADALRAAYQNLAAAAMRIEELRTIARELRAIR